MARRLDYLLRETAIGLRRNWVVTFAAISTVFISLFLLGSFLLLSKQAGAWIDLYTAKVEVAVFLTDDISLEQQNRLGEMLNDMPEVSTVHYESKDEAYARFKELFKSNPSLVENVSKDALPASYRVKLKEPDKFKVVAARLEGQPGIDEIRDQREYLDQFFAVAKALRYGLLAVGGIMLISAALLIANTVRMSLFARRKEIGIMKLVGATNWYVRVPFLVEGIIQGLLGAAIALLGIFAIKEFVIDPAQVNFQWLPFLATSDTLFAIPLMLGAGMAVATIASLLAMRRLLDV
jgi:cell division transport system permease protein